jgi:hypothetical protein
MKFATGDGFLTGSQIEKHLGNSCVVKCLYFSNMVLAHKQPLHVEDFSSTETCPVLISSKNKD